VQFRKMVEVLGLPELADDPRFARNEDRNANREQLRPLLVERLRTKTTQEWFGEFIDAGVPCGPVNTVDQGVALAAEVGLEPIVTVGEGDRALPVIRHPIRYSDTPAGYRLAPPRLGEHTDSIREWLASPQAADPL
jgi:crotonobetainyl-CoA:carnitine CoA-transferase CaiB-like acyl-CoA transferase